MRLPLGDEVAAFVKQRSRKIQERVNRAFDQAQQWFLHSGTIREDSKELLRMAAVHQLTQEQLTVRVPAWYIGRQRLQYSTELVDQISEQTDCKATIFQRIPQGFLRISTNIETLSGKRAVGTFIPNDSPIAQAALQGEAYRGSAFVLSNWYASVYEPFEVGGEIKGILYVGVKEELPDGGEDILQHEHIEALARQMLQGHNGQNAGGVVPLHQLIDYFSNPRRQPALHNHPLLELGLKELAVLLMQERMRRQSREEAWEEQQLRLLRNYVQAHLDEEISVDVLAKLACTSKASLYRYLREKLNLTPVEFINAERLKEAARLLREEPEAHVQDVCLRTGFKNCSYFIKLFRQRYELTPRQYRESIVELQAAG